jgi:hypothetical protein
MLTPQVGRWRQLLNCGVSYVKLELSPWKKQRSSPSQINHAYETYSWSKAVVLLRSWISRMIYQNNGYRVWRQWSAKWHHNAEQDMREKYITCSMQQTVFTLGLQGVMETPSMQFGPIFLYPSTYFLS